MANPTPAAPQVVLWNLPANDCLAPLQGHKRTVTNVRFSPDSKMLATCSTVGARADGRRGREARPGLLLASRAPAVHALAVRSAWGPRRG